MNAYAHLRRLSEDRESMTLLGAMCRIESPELTGQVFSGTTAAVVRLIEEYAKSAQGRSGLSVAARALTWSEREDPRELFVSGHPRIGEAVTKAIFGATLESAVQRVASTAEVTEINAGVFVETTATVVLACLAGNPDEHAQPEFLFAADGEDSAMITPTHGVAGALATALAAATAGAGSETRAISSIANTTPDRSQAAASSDRLGRGAADHSAPTPDDDKGAKKRPMLLLGAAVLAIVGVIGAATLIGGGGSDGDADEQVSVDQAGDALPLDARSGEDDNAAAPSTTVESTDDGEPTPAAIDDDDLRSNSEVEDDEGADPDIVTLSVPMRDIEEISGEAEGTLTFDFNTVTGEVCYEIESINIDGPYRSHIHVGEAGVKGGIVVDLGPQVSGAVGCVENLAVDTNAILANPAGHYAELHDVTEEFTIRGQLSEATAAERSEGGDRVDPVVDTDGGGASIVLDAGVIYLVGDVPDQATADELVESLSNVDDDTQVINDLTVVEGAPVPSGRVVIADAIFFEVASSDVKSINPRALDAITALASSRPDWVLTVVGHTDSAGSDVENLELSLARAAAVRDVLSEQGIADENLRIRGAGETTPLGDNSTDAGRAQNRRIEFEFTPKG